MLPQDFASHITEIILGAGSLFVFLAKYKEVLSFVWRLLVLLTKPIQCVWRWIKLAQNFLQQPAENKNEIENLRKEISSLTSFVKEKLSPNGGSSPIDAIKRIEDRQLASDARANALLNDSKLGVFYCDLEGRNVWVNRTYARFIGCGVDELLGFGWKKFIRTDELERYNKIWRTAFQDGCEFDETVEFLTVEHQKIRLHISVSVIKDIKGKTASYIGQILPL